MKITPDLFETFLKCATKCWLNATGQVSTGNAYAEWVKSQDDSYHSNEAARLLGNLPSGDVATSSEPETLKSAKWRFATNVGVQAQVSSCCVESNLHAVERASSRGRGKATQFIPIRFVVRNKLSKDDKLLLAFDAFVLAQVLGRDIAVAKIIHGDHHITLRVKTSALVAEVQKRVQKIAVCLASPTPPDLVLNRHCSECEFRDRCRRQALESDDLSLLAGMSTKERQKLRSKGIFTVTQTQRTGGSA